MDCTFSILNISNYNNNNFCQNTCIGQQIIPTNHDKNNNDFNSNDLRYQTRQSMLQCIEKECSIQVTECTNNTVCSNCYQDKIQNSCYTNDIFISLSDCTLCKCSEHNNIPYCATKIIDEFTNNGVINKPIICSSKEKILGNDAIIKYSTKCTNFTNMDIFLTQFDTKHFGLLNQFELCVYNYEKYNKYNNVSAYDCMYLLIDAITNINDHDEKDPVYVINKIASSLYNNGKEFCDCTEIVYTETPSCPTFINFNTLIVESLDACDSLDAIECDAWSEFLLLCYPNVHKQFNNVINFTSKEQCMYVQNDCGNIGPLPSYRKSDCNYYIDVSIRHFYNDYINNCQIDSHTNHNSISFDNNALDNNNSYERSKQPYIPPEERNKIVKKNTIEKSKTLYIFRNFIIFCIISYVVYYVYRSRNIFSSYQPLNKPIFLSRIFGYGNRIIIDDNDTDIGISLEQVKPVKTISSMPIITTVSAS